jgi:hypothetical protein
MISKDVKEFLIMISTISIILIVIFTVMNLTRGTRSEFQQKVDSALDAIKDTKKDTVITIKSGTTKMVIRVKK